jgi:hypothetical protein
MSWALNVCPLLRPALSSGYRKIAGKNHPNTPLYAEVTVSGTSRNLLTLSAHSAASTVHILRSPHGLRERLMSCFSATRAPLGLVSGRRLRFMGSFINFPLIASSTGTTRFSGSRLCASRLRLSLPPHLSLLRRMWSFLLITSTRFKYSTRFAHPESTTPSSFLCTRTY